MLRLWSKKVKTKMPDQNNDTNPVQNDSAEAPVSGVVSDIIDQINSAKNILVALSKNPSVDELSAAIGLSMFLERIGKNTTTIYSGTTPDVLEFLKPDETFERSADVLQDFVIALDKNKADHLRYKVDGDFVKIFITPYKSKVSGSDLEFSYGDFNVDLVFAIDVSNGIELDSALREHGRIMHDATIVNLTTSAPGKFGEIEWSNQSASSISEMITELLFAMNERPESQEATAFLTGIVAATNSFSNARTTSDTMRLSSKLMEAGANQQLVSMHVNAETENELFNTDKQPDNLNIVHEEEAVVETPVVETPVVEAPVVEAPVVEAPVVETPTFETSVTETPTFEAPTFEAPAEVPAMDTPLESTPLEEPVAPAPIFDTQGVTVEPAPVSADLVQPTVEENFSVGNTENYGQMLEDALNETMNPAAENAPVAPVEPEINGVPVMNYEPAVDEILTPPPVPPVNVDVPPATIETTFMEPVSQSAPEPQPIVEPQPISEPQPAYDAQPISEPQPAVVPETETMQMPTLSETPVTPAAPQAQSYAPAPDDVSAFKIPNVN